MRNFTAFPVLNQNNALTTTKLHSFLQIKVIKIPEIITIFTREPDATGSFNLSWYNCCD